LGVSVRERIKVKKSPPHFCTFEEDGGEKGGDSQQTATKRRRRFDSRGTWNETQRKSPAARPAKRGPIS